MHILKELILFILLLFATTQFSYSQAVDSTKQAQTTKTQVTKAEINEPSFFTKVMGYADSLASLRTKLVEVSLSFLGTPYKYASVGPTTFDCSGFISYIYQFYNIMLPHSSSLQSKMGKLVDLSNAIKGDLIFFGYINRDGSYSVSHVGMVYNNNNGVVEMIHASTSDGVRIDKTDSNTWNSYWSRKFLFVKRIID